MYKDLNLRLLESLRLDPEDGCVKGAPLPSQLPASDDRSQEIPPPFPSTSCLLTGQQAALRAGGAVACKVGAGHSTNITCALIKHSDPGA